MRKLLSLAGVAVALTLTSAGAYAADHNNRFERNHNVPGFSQQQNDRRFDGNNDRNRKFPVTQNQQHNVQPNFNPQKNWQNNDRKNRNNWADNNRNNDNWRNDNRRNNDNWRNNNDWRNNQNFRFNRYAQQRFRVGVYHGPRSFNYHRWSYGDRLPFVYLSSNYWLPNAILYGLFAPPPGLVWVRYGDDALLVDRYTGEIVQVRYNIFY